MTDRSKQTLRRGIPVVLAVLALSFLVEGVAGETRGAQAEPYDRFTLLDTCRPMALVVEDLSPDAFEIGLTETAIRFEVEQRLRSDLLYDPDAWSYLYINVTMAGTAFTTGVSYHKRMHDRASNVSSWASTWKAGFTGMTDDPDDILAFIAQDTERFTDEFLRVNGEACDHRFEAPDHRIVE